MFRQAELILRPELVRLAGKKKRLDKNFREYNYLLLYKKQVFINKCGTRPKVGEWGKRLVFTILSFNLTIPIRDRFIRQFSIHQKKLIHKNSPKHLIYSMKILHLNHIYTF